MTRQDILNIAGIGYLQGKIIEHLDEHFVHHEVKVDGMFGPKTLAGLNWISNSRFSDTVELNLPVSSKIVAVDWTEGVLVFQNWYRGIHNKQLQRRGKTSLPSPEYDGKWGPLTKAIVDEITRITN